MPLIILAAVTEALHAGSLDHFPFLAIHISSCCVSSFIRSFSLPVSALCFCYCTSKDSDQLENPSATETIVDNFETASVKRFISLLQ